MKKVFLVIFILGFLVATPAYGHKLISHDDDHRSFDTALLIPDHIISWAIYENLGENEAKFYSFDAKKGDSLYASIVIPAIQGLEEYSPTLVLINPEKLDSQTDSMFSQSIAQKFPYEGKYPGKEFYEPFGQITYWERQEIRTEISGDGKYYLVVMDEKNQSGKYSLAIGTIEDFSWIDIFTTLPMAWFDSKIFVDDFLSIAILFFIIVSLIIIPLFVFKKPKLVTN